MNKIKFIWLYLKNVNPFYWPLFFCIPNLVSEYPNSDEVGDYELTVYKEYFAPIVYSTKVCKNVTANEAYFKLRSMALKADFRVNNIYGITYSLKKLNKGL